MTAEATVSISDALDDLGAKVQLYTIGTDELDIVSFEQYREICDRADSYRRLGVLDRHKYDEALLDSSTVFGSIGAAAVPQLIRLDFEEGYDADKTAQLAGSTTPMLLAVPPSVIDGTEMVLNQFGGESLAEDYVVLVEDRGPLDQETRQSLADKLARPGDNMYPAEFFDLPSKPGYETAWTALYALRYGPSYDSLLRFRSASTLSEAWEHHKEDNNLSDEVAVDSNATYMFTGEELRKNPDLVDRLWDITEVGFGQVLGKNHPVSMQESREFFEHHLLSGGNYIFVRFADGVPMCFGSMSESLKDCEWMNLGSKVLQDQLSALDTNLELPLYFSEVISAGVTGAGLAKDVFNLVFELTARRKVYFRVFFESTNRSSRYIPRGIETSLRKSGLVKMTNDGQKIDMVDRVDYWFLKQEVDGDVND